MLEPRVLERVAELEAENARLRRGLRQIWEGNYPAEAGDAESWAKELLDDLNAVDWDDESEGE